MNPYEQRRRRVLSEAITRTTEEIEALMTR